MKRMTSFCCDPQNQSYLKEKQIMNNFKRRRALLDEEEETERAALREETRQKIHMTNVIADTTEGMLVLSEIKANRSFLTNKRFTEVNIRSHDRFNS